MTVTVLGTFGVEASPLLGRAALLLALDDLRQDDSSSLLGNLPENIRSLSVEGLSVTLAADDTLKAGPSTGNATAVRYIDAAAGRRPSFIA